MFIAKDGLLKIGIPIVRNHQQQTLLNMGWDGSIVGSANEDLL